MLQFARGASALKRVSSGMTMKRAGIGVTTFATDFAVRKMSGEDTGEAMLKSGAYAAAYMYSPWLAGAYEMYRLGEFTGQLYKDGKKLAESDRMRVGNQNFGSGTSAFGNEYAYTQRQRAVAVARQSRQSASSYGLGHEARAMSRMRTR